MCVDFCSRGKRAATWSPRCALTSLCRHTYVQCGLFVRAQITKDRCNLTKMLAMCFFKYFNRGVLVGSPLEINNPVPAGPAQFPQFGVIELFGSKLATSAVIVGHSSNDI